MTSMKNGKMELVTEEETVVEWKIFQEDWLSPQLFVITKMSLNYDKNVKKEVTIL